MNKINLSQEKATLLIPLFGKAKEYLSKSPLIIDEKAVWIVNQIDYDFQSLKIPEKTNKLMCLRAKLIDNLVNDMLLKRNRSTVIHLGCGLDSRYNRINNSDVDWYDVDFQEVIDIRKHFYKETDKYHLIGSSVTESEWIAKIPKAKDRYIVIAEGLFMYLKEDEIKTLTMRLNASIGSYTLIFDAYSSLTAQRAKSHPSIKKTGAVIQWGIDNPEELLKWGLDIRFVAERYFMENEAIRNLDSKMRIMFKIAGLFAVVRKAHRLLIYEVGNGNLFGS
jgi:O-methyltransferase involved in polyketide biosynthesis